MRKPNAPSSRSVCLVWLGLLGGMALTVTDGATAAMSPQSPTSSQSPESSSRPNIVIVLADDLGLGDLSCLNPNAATATPNLDRVAAAGARFTDAHSPSAVCSPTRYGILTGRYCWRSSLKSGVLWTNDPLLIEPDRPTIATELATRGYETAFIGKWHLGLGAQGPTDWTAPLDGGPHTVGFERSVGIPSSLDIPPYCWFRDGVGDPPPTTTIEGSEHRRQDGGGFWRAGAIGEGFVHQEVLARSVDESIAVVQNHAKANDGRPLFLELCLSAPHTPWLPTDRFQGTSTAGHYGDFVNEIDFEVGRLLAALENSGLAENTLFIFTSDNGSHWPVADRQRWGHAANLDWRGQKADIYEAGHRVPLLVRWPSVVAPGTTIKETVCLTDLYATSIAAAGESESATAPPPSQGGEDSINLVPLLAKGNTAGLADRTGIVHHSLDGMFAIRVGDWKLIEGLGSGGFTAPKRRAANDGEPTVQLYNLATDPREAKNIAARHPGEVARLQAILDRIRADD